MTKYNPDSTEITILKDHLAKLKTEISALQAKCILQLERIPKNSLIYSFIFQINKLTKASLIKITLLEDPAKFESKEDEYHHLMKMINGNEIPDFSRLFSKMEAFIKVLSILNDAIDHLREEHSKENKENSKSIDIERYSNIITGFLKDQDNIIFFPYISRLRDLLENFQKIKNFRKDFYNKDISTILLTIKKELLALFSFYTTGTILDPIKKEIKKVMTRMEALDDLGGVFLNKSLIVNYIKKYPDMPNFVSEVSQLNSNDISSVFADSVKDIIFLRNVISDLTIFNETVKEKLLGFFNPLQRNMDYIQSLLQSNDHLEGIETLNILRQNFEAQKEGLIACYGGYKIDLQIERAVNSILTKFKYIIEGPASEKNEFPNFFKLIQAVKVKMSENMDLEESFIELLNNLEQTQTFLEMWISSTNSAVKEDLMYTIQEYFVGSGDNLDELTYEIDMKNVREIYDELDSEIDYYLEKNTIKEIQPPPAQQLKHGIYSS